MPSLNRAWNSVRRFISRTGTTDSGATAGTDSAAGRSNGGLQTHHGALQALHAGGRRLFRLSERMREWMQEAQRDSERVRREAIRNERRANRRACILLMRLLNPDQRQEFRKYRHFHVVGASSGDRYRIRPDLIANIDVLRPDGSAKYRLCVRPNCDIPVYDVMAAQLLHLQDATTELRFVKQANILSTLP